MNTTSHYSMFVVGLLLIIDMSRAKPAFSVRYVPLALRLQWLSADAIFKEFADVVGAINILAVDSTRRSGGQRRFSNLPNGVG
ncbi:hypothetical protein QMZ05_26655 [Bradyrhizobium sp. INPA03-11B]|uniref:hypothetical protein n=1 Tax=Bradyrhizobium sp. INPA03-11B TaxID=418598 RepID=UPI00338E8D5D